jgi:hypothetical protein
MNMSENNFGVNPFPLSSEKARSIFSGTSNLPFTPQRYQILSYYALVMAQPTFEQCQLSQLPPLQLVPTSSNQIIRSQNSWQVNETLNQVSSQDVTKTVKKFSFFLSFFFTLFFSVYCWFMFILLSFLK